MKIKRTKLAELLRTLKEGDVETLPKRKVSPWMVPEKEKEKTPEKKHNPLTPPQHAPKTKPKACHLEEESEMVGKITKRYQELSNKKKGYTESVKSNREAILESIKDAKRFVDNGTLSQEDLKSLIDIDPSPTKKYVGWLAKVWIKEKPNLEDLRNSIEEFDTLSNRGRTEIRDIYRVRSFEDLKKEVEEINKRGDNLSLKDLEDDYETVVDNEDVLVCVPYTHEASRKLGLSKFASRGCEGGGRDSVWCTTHKKSGYFLGYFINQKITFYYIKARSERMIERLKEAFPGNYKALIITAVRVYPDGRMDIHDSTNVMYGENFARKYLSTLGLT